MIVAPFETHALNRHYEGAYTSDELEWRRLGAIDKAGNVRDLLAGRAVDSVLEVGCGTGSVLAQLAKLRVGGRHVGVDIADPNAHRSPEAAGLDLRSYDGTSLPFADHSFDLVVASHVVEHVPNPRGFIVELGRVAKNFVYIEVPCEVRARMSHSTLQSALNTGHINGYSPEHFLILLQTSGLEVLDLQLFDHSLAVHRFNVSALTGRIRMSIRRSFLQISPLLAARIFCYHCGALARASVYAVSDQREPIDPSTSQARHV